MTTGVPISNLPAASTPLSGAELAVVVQGGTTVQVPVSAIGGGGLLRLLLTAVDAIAAGITNNLATDISNANRLILFPAGDATVTGLAGGVDGQIMVVENLSAFLLTLPTNDAGSLAINRWFNNGDTFIPPNCAAAFMYNGIGWVKI